MGDVAAVEPDGAAGRLQQPKHGTRHRRLAAAALADEAQGLALADAEAHAVDRIDLPDGAADDALLDREMLGEVNDLQHRRLVRAAGHDPRPATLSECQQAAQWRGRFSSSGG